MTRAWVDELTAEVERGRVELLGTLRELAEANARTSEANARTAEANARIAEANARTAEARGEVVAAQRHLASAVKAQAEAERVSLDRLRELGLVHARGIIEWAEVRSKLCDPKRATMNRFLLWTHILRMNPQLQACLVRAGWPEGTLASNMVGLYAGLSSDIHKDATPHVANAIGGIVISLNDSGAGVSATTGKVLLCLARANFIRASLQGANGQVIEDSPGLADARKSKQFAAEEHARASAFNERANEPMV